ncbi:hypothetical protein FNYG_05252 [Fusarium nygamai]|uniref:Uncharacterized protein n=1 Tax=Gibberella nygamai TaxID=42673 RepID=A0A2K0WGP9_GIBNY|nr:hypothetical protein FNYG_05252 [Fusarium nygamai]
MGLFSNIWDGIKSAGRWVIDHAGDIASAVAAVAKVASHLLTLDTSTPSFAANAILKSQENATESQMLAAYHENFGYASDRLAATAKAGVKAPPKMTGKTITIDDGLVGLWTYPEGLSSDGNPSASMYQDLSAFMGTMNIPVSWKDDSGVVHDTVNELGQVLFAKTGPKDLTVLSKSENPIVEVNAEVPTQDGFIHACHVYYPIPMGNGEERNSLHSAIRLSYTTKA